MNTRYKSVINDPSLFWVNDKRTGAWILGQYRRHKRSGQLLSTWNERVLLDGRKLADLTEARLMTVFSQVENDWVFADAAGQTTGHTTDGSLRQEIDRIFQYKV
jgi:hypothetical protein